MITNCGFFGKVITHGDFVTRRLPPEFVHRWDSWLQACQLAGRDYLGERWQALYLNSPLWRFVLAPGVCGESAWVGLMMPGIDKVGRHFPLTLALPLVFGVPPQAWLLGSGPWFERLEALALSSLRLDFSLEAFDRALSAITFPVQGVALTGAGETGHWVYQLEDFRQMDVGFQTLGALRPAHSMWWSDGSPHVLPCIAQCEGLPGVDRCLAMLDGEWSSHGWRPISPALPGSESSTR